VSLPPRPLIWSFFAVPVSVFAPAVPLSVLPTALCPDDCWPVVEVGVVVVGPTLDHVAKSSALPAWFSVVPSDAYGVQRPPGR
jgi:hypothetical protein